MTSNEMCNTGHGPKRWLKRNSVFKMTINVLNDCKGPDNIICTLMMLQGDVFMAATGTTLGRCKHKHKNTLMCLSIGTPKNYEFPFVPNGKFIIFRCPKI